MNGMMTSNDHLRFERKFVADDLGRRQVERIVRLHPSAFREIFHARQINNIYFDTLSRRHYWDSVEGAPARLKVRIRWYGETFEDVSSPVLELKHKCGLMVWKESCPMRGFCLSSGSDLRQLREIVRNAVLESGLRDDVISMIPVLLNRYRRTYYLSSDKGYRITIDDCLCSYRLRPRRNSFLDKTIDDRHVILELKYGCKWWDNADRIARRFPFRVSRWSKYVNGLTPHRV
jgi:hypothetical protein